MRSVCRGVTVLAAGALLLVACGGPAEVENEAAAPVPDADLVAAPCAAHEGREVEAFIDLVAPVDEQVAGDEVEIVGCSNVNEATVNWRLLDGDGRTLDE